MRESTFFQALPFQALCMLIAAVVLALIGPFGTFVDLSLGQRLAYWSLSMLAGWPVIVGIAAAFDRIEALQVWPISGRMALAGFIGGLPMAAIVWVLEALFRHKLPLAALPQLYMHTTVLAIVLAVGVGQMVELRLQARAGAPRLSARGGAPTPEPSQPPPVAAAPAPSSSDSFLRRLPPALGRDLLALEMEDHYARVHTALGSTLVLMRLRDAMTELGAGSGLQVHRSWWVAHGAVARVERDGGKLALLLRNGLHVPVSKTYRDAVRAARWGDA